LQFLIGEARRNQVTEYERFLRDEFLRMTLNGALRTRGAEAVVYAPDVSDAAKEDFREYFRKVLVVAAKAYEKTVTDRQHFTRINNLADGLSNTFGAVLAGQRMRIGIVQKALNLYLKYLWTVGKIPEPPQCPFDNLVIARVPGSWTRWTRLDSLDEYVRLVAAARVEAGGISLAEWELRLFNLNRDPDERE
jgi:hypothetical protein